MSKQASSAGILGCLFPTLFIVGLLILTLKLAQIGLPATWSWWLVLLPWYILPLGLALLFVVGFGGAFIFDWLSSVARWHRRRKQAARVKKNDAKVAARAAENDAFFKRADEELKRRGEK